MVLPVLARTLRMNHQTSRQLPCCVRTDCRHEVDVGRGGSGSSGEPLTSSETSGLRRILTSELPQALHRVSDELLDRTNAVKRHTKKVVAAATETSVTINCQLKFT